MKTLTLHINDSIYGDVKRFLSLFSSEKIKIEEKTSNDIQNRISFSYAEFEKKWAGFLQNEKIGENWKDERFEELHKKHL
ncbi:MAG: hypothetical protein GXO89_13270 [Chlorobi bacterium]|nr:hypothetical protein [Chlorobiota bacterium]